jgi:hypothetical protein
VTLRFVSDTLMKFLWNLSLETASTLLTFRCVNTDSWQHCLIWYSKVFNHRMWLLTLDLKKNVRITEELLKLLIRISD